MVRRVRLIVAAGLIAGLLTASARAQSLGDLARAERNDAADKPKAKRLITNDDLNSVPQPSSSPSTPGTGPSGTAPVGTPRLAPAGNQGGDAKSTSNAIWAARIREAQIKVANLQSALSDLERSQNAIRRAAWYGDPAAAMEDPIKRQDEQRRLADDIENKRHELTEARRDLEDTLARARQAGYAAGF